MKAIGNSVIYLGIGTKIRGEIFFEHCTFICCYGLTKQKGEQLIKNQKNCLFLEKMSIIARMRLFFKAWKCGYLNHYIVPEIKNYFHENPYGKDT